MQHWVKLSKSGLCKDYKKAEREDKQLKHLSKVLDNAKTAHYGLGDSKTITVEEKDDFLQQMAQLREQMEQGVEESLSNSKLEGLKVENKPYNASTDVPFSPQLRQQARGGRTRRR